MLTKTDLGQIRRIVKEETVVQTDGLRKEFRAGVELTRTDLGKEIRSTRADLHSEIQLFRNDLHKEISALSQSVRRIQRKLDKVIDFFDHEHLGLVKRIERVENHLNLPSGF